MVRWHVNAVRLPYGEEPEDIGSGAELLPGRFALPGGLVDAMRAAGPAKRSYDPATAPVLELLSRLLARRDLEDVTLEKAGFRLALRRNARAGA